VGALLGMPVELFSIYSCSLERSLSLGVGLIDVFVFAGDGHSTCLVISLHNRERRMPWVLESALFS